MAKVSIYLNFASETERAFEFYKTVFKSQFSEIMRFGDIPPAPLAPTLPERDKKLIMHIELPILNDFVLMGSDAPESMGFKVIKGNNSYIMLQPDSKEETKELFYALSVGGMIEQELQEMFWGGYYGSLTDKFGVQWMFNFQ